MEQLGEFWWVIPVGSFLGSLWFAFAGYIKKPPESTASIQGAAIMDSTIGHEVVAQLRRIADAAEDINEYLEKAAQASDIRAAVAEALRKEKGK